MGASTIWPLSSGLCHLEQAQERSRQALALAHQRADPFSLSITRYQAARFHYHRREPQAVREHIEALLALAREQGFALYEAKGTNLHGWDWTEPSQAEAGLAQMHQGLAALKRTGPGLLRPIWRGWRRPMAKEDSLARALHPGG